MTRRAVLALLGAALVAGPIASCARNPVTGKNEISLVSESQEIQMGQQAAQEVGQSIGFVDDPELQAYVAGIGKRMAAKSERPNLPWEFHVVNDAAVNAFALPGGFIYVTRGLLAHMNSEAELATVLGHEVGHVTARHSVQQISKAQLATLGLGVGSILSSDIAQFAGIASQGLGVLFLKYGRDAENQADQLGFKYALGLNYDVREMANVFETLNRASQVGGEGGRLPEWLSTHPNPENRVARTQQRLDTLTTPLDNTLVGRDEYLRQIDGITFGEDPRQGFFEGSTFYHPDMRFQLQFPEGWKTQNTPSAVVAREPEAGRHHPARPGRHHAAAGGGVQVPLAGRGSRGPELDRQHQRQPVGDQLLPGPDRTGRDRGTGLVHLVRRQDVRADGLHAAGQAGQLRRRATELHQQLRPAQELGRARGQAGRRSSW